MRIEEATGSLYLGHPGRKRSVAPKLPQETMNTATHSTKKRRHWIAIVATLVIVVGGGLWLHGRASTASAATQAAPRVSAAVPVTMATVEMRDVDVALNALGTVAPVSMVTITSRVTGVLQEIHYTEGQMVQQGDLLAVIDPRPYHAALAQAQGQLARDQALLANARLDLERDRTTYRAHAISEQEVATQEALVNEDEGIVMLDQGSVEAAQVNVDYTHINSPISGRVGLRLIDPGNNVSANGTSGLVTVTQLQPITVIFTLAQDYLAQVMQEMRRGATLRVAAFDRTNPHPIAEGQLLTIDNQVEAATGTFRLKAQFLNEDLVLWPGEFVNLRFVVGVRKGALTVPTRSVQRGPNGNFLFVIKPDMTVEMRNVEVAQTDQDVVVISKGLAAGERIVVDGQYRLEQGTRVTLQAPANGTGA